MFLYCFSSRFFFCSFTSFFDFASSRCPLFSCSSTFLASSAFPLSSLHLLHSCIPSSQLGDRPSFYYSDRKYERSLDFLGHVLAIDRAFARCATISSGFHCILLSHRLLLLCTCVYFLVYPLFSIPLIYIDATIPKTCSSTARGKYFLNFLPPPAVSAEESSSALDTHCRFETATQASARPG